MIAPTWPHRRRPGMWAALAVALAHLAWLQLAWRPWTSTGHAPPEPVTWLRLLPDLEAPAARARPEPPSVRAGHLTPEHTAAAPASSEHPPAIAPTAPPAPQPITLPTETRATPVAPLDLAPRRGFDAPRDVRGQVLRDPRANSARRSPTDGLEALAGDRTRLAEERLAGEGRRRITIRGKCFEVHDARIGQLDPFTQSSTPTPKQARPCD